MRIRQIVTARGSGRKLAEAETLQSVKYYDEIPPMDQTGAHPGDIEGGQIIVHPGEVFQTWQGFGGAFTDSAASAWAAMDDKSRNKLIDAYFSPQGIGYNYGRMHIGSCDFSANAYSYIEEGDETLESFSLGREEKTVFAFVSAALERNKDIFLFASPWSPPLFMKDNGRYQGGRLLKRYYGLWADYIARYIREYAKQGVKISAVTVQNEPRHAQLWESCVFTKEEELELASDYLAARLKPLGVKIYVYDHCRERVFERAEYAFTRCGDIDGIACHWYSGDYFDELSLTRRKFPDKDIIVSESCVGLSSLPPDENAMWEAAGRYARDIAWDIRAGASAFCDWNLTLDERRGPCHFREHRPCVADAPAICDRQKGEVTLQPSFCAIGQFSKFIKKGARIIGCSKAFGDVETVAARNPDGEIVAVAVNCGEAKNVVLHMGEDVARTRLEENGITTFVFQPDRR